MSEETRTQISFRPIVADDAEFLCAVYASTRTEELAVVPWSAQQKEAFLRSQFAAQHDHYQAHYAGASFEVILLRKQPVGRLYVARWEHEIRIVDIALLPEHRRAGIGTMLLNEILAEGRQSNKSVSIHVEQFNPALRLYQRLGFSRISEHGPYYLMSWRAPEIKQATVN